MSADVPNVLIVTTHFPPRRGGVETSNLQYLSVNEAAAVCRLVVVTYEDRGAESFDDVWRHAVVVRVPVPPRHLHQMIDLESLGDIHSSSLFNRVSYLSRHTFYLLRGMAAARRRLGDVDAIIANGAMAEGIAACLLAAWRRRPFVFRWRTDMAAFVRGRAGRWLVRTVMRRATRILVNGAHVRDALVRLGCGDPARIGIVRHGVDTERFKPVDRSAARNTLGLPRDPRIVLFAGVFDRTSFCDLLADVARAIIPADRAYFFVFIGRGPLLSDLQALAARHPARVRLHPQQVSQDTLSTYISAADAVVAKADITYPSRLAIETLACGVPVLMPDRPVSNQTSGADHGRVVLDPSLPGITLLPADARTWTAFLLSEWPRVSAAKSSEAAAARTFVLERHDMHTIVEDELRMLASAVSCSTACPAAQ